ncbi:MAG: hypothetical protein HWN80_06420 [Candidatus Lokiarchaeota archaeon]|nr:hypothetical protein [Candidatus Lokiarchaeota archaeon]
MEKRVRKVKCPHCGNIGNTEGERFDNQFGWRVSNGFRSITLICNRCGRYTIFHDKLDSKKQQKKARIFIGKKDEIWQKYLRMKANKDVNLNSFTNDESVKYVIEKKILKYIWERVVNYIIGIIVDIYLVQERLST